MIELSFHPVCGRCEKSDGLVLQTGLNSQGIPKSRFWCSKCREHVGTPIDLPLSDDQSRVLTRWMQTSASGPNPSFDTPKQPKPEKAKEAAKL